jgi:hypothetical protein
MPIPCSLVPLFPRSLVPCSCQAPQTQLFLLPLPPQSVSRTVILPHISPNLLALNQWIGGRTAHGPPSTVHRPRPTAHRPRRQKKRKKKAIFEGAQIVNRFQKLQPMMNEEFRSKNVTRICLHLFRAKLRSKALSRKKGVFLTCIYEMHQFRSRMPDHCSLTTVPGAYCLVPIACLTSPASPHPPP